MKKTLLKLLLLLSHLLMRPSAHPITSLVNEADTETFYTLSTRMPVKLEGSTLPFSFYLTLKSISQQHRSLLQTNTIQQGNRRFSQTAAV